jgi:hypothetical protein
MINSSSMMDQLAEKVAQLSTSNPTQIIELADYNLNMTIKPSLESYLGSLSSLLDPFLLGPQDTASIAREYNSDYHLDPSKERKPFPLRPYNLATSYQTSFQDSINSVRRVPLTTAQKGLVLTITPQDYIVHWSGSLRKQKCSVHRHDDKSTLPRREQDLRPQSINRNS